MREKTIYTFSFPLTLIIDLYEGILIEARLARREQLSGTLANNEALLSLAMLRRH